MFININSGFFLNRQKKFLAIFFRILQLRIWKITISALTSVNFHRSFWNMARTFPKIVDEFDYGGSASLYMCIMDHWMRWSILAFLDWFLAATKQLYDWFSPSVHPSVCLSVCLSVCHTFFTMFPSSYHHEIFRSYYQWQKWHPCKRSRSEVKGQGHRGQHPT